MTRQEILMLVGFLLLAISGILFLISWPLIAQGLSGGLTIFLIAIPFGIVGGILWMISVLRG
jgi:hypothetical protein